MNKSKFLKKSLAMVLAVMMIVAMIPLGASAEWVNDGTIVSITSSVGELTGSGSTFTDALPYYAGGETLTIKVATGVTAVEYAIDEGEGQKATVDNATATITVPSGSSTVNFQAYAEDEAVGSEYTVTLTKADASADTSIKEATLGEGDTAVAGVVDNTKKTITFTVPWGYTVSDGGVTATAVLNYPVYDTTESAEKPATATVTAIGTDVAMTVTSQQGSSTTYTVVTKEAECLKTLTIGGVAAVLGTDETDTNTYGKYSVALPVGTELGNDTELEISYTTAAAAKTVTWKASTESTAKEIEDGKVAVSKVVGTYEIAFADKDENTKTYEVIISVTQSDDASISAFTATVGNYTETGVISGDKLTVELPSTTTEQELKSVKLEITAAAGATVKVGSTTVSADNNNPAVFTASAVDLSSAVTVEVTAPDEKTVKYYQLTATVASDPYNDPKITAAKLTIGDDAYTGTINDTAITFTVPYATTNKEAKAGVFTWAKTQATTISEISWDSADVFEGTNTIAVTSDSDAKKTYTVVLNKQPAKTGKTLTALSFVEGTDEDNITATHTAAVSADKVTVTLPYSYKNKDSFESVVQFTLPEGAALYVNNDDNLAASALVSGFSDDASANNEVALIGTNKITKFVVVDETLVLTLKENAEKATPDSIVIDSLSSAHATVYEVVIENAPAETGHTLTAFSADDGKVTSKISANAIEITVPASYAKSGNEVGFFADYTASKLATVKANDTILPATYDETTTDGKLKVKVTDGVAALYTGEEEVKTITVTSEAGTDTTVYNVTVKVAPYKTEALLKSLTVNNVKGVINNTAKTVTVTLPFNADLTAVTVAYTASDMASTVVALSPTDESTDEVNYYDVSESFKVTVTAEDEATVNVYTVTVTAAEQFSDVSENAWYHDNVYAAAAAGIISGYPDGTFKPTNSITRQDFAVMLANMLGADVSGYTTTPFSDVSSNYATGAIAYCAENGYMTGDGNGKFRPTDNITRQEAASTMARALNLTGTSSEKFTDDAKIASWAKTAVYACKAAGVFSGDKGTGNFRPTDKITRAEAATIMVQAAK